ncbi:hypothetical protein IWQ60_008988 [Tieghemiomyces parasiticus]|uniref:Uncharacterized protein n=1 Tax=Tieghemiomyces parasiticus TaxID=78921 RepID=A0A9W7ZPR2_9FUNG|nr:hypothetical protein IWQ60_008988 [Tieghemiomyces parasiticus]
MAAKRPLVQTEAAGPRPLERGRKSSDKGKQPALTADDNATPGCILIPIEKREEFVPLNKRPENDGFLVDTVPRHYTAGSVALRTDVLSANSPPAAAPEPTIHQATAGHLKPRRRKAVVLRSEDVLTVDEWQALQLGPTIQAEVCRAFSEAQKHRSVTARQPNNNCKALMGAVIIMTVYAYGHTPTIKTIRQALPTVKLAKVNDFVSVLKGIYGCEVFPPKQQSLPLSQQFHEAANGKLRLPEHTFVAAGIQVLLKIESTGIMSGLPSSSIIGAILWLTLLQFRHYARHLPTYDPSRPSVPPKSIVENTAIKDKYLSQPPEFIRGFERWRLNYLRQHISTLSSNTAAAEQYLAYASFEDLNEQLRALLTSTNRPFGLVAASSGPHGGGQGPVLLNMSGTTTTSDKPGMS